MQGAKTSGRIPREATLKLSLSLSTALSSESITSELFKDANDAAAGALDLAGAAAFAATEQYQSAVRLQNMTGQVRLLFRLFAFTTILAAKLIHTSISLLSGYRI